MLLGVLPLRRKSTPNASQPLLTKEQLMAEFDRALKIKHENPLKFYRKSSRRLPKDPRTNTKRVLLHDNKDDSLWLATNAGMKNALIYEFGPLALCEGHENIVRFKESFLYNNSYMAITEIPNNLAIPLNTLLKRIQKNHRISLKRAQNQLENAAVTPVDSDEDTSSSANDEGNDNQIQKKSTPDAVAKKSTLQKKSSGQNERLMKQPTDWTEEMILFVIGEVLKALSFMHERNIIHRDVVPMSIVCDEQGGVKISDTLFAYVLTAENPTCSEPKGEVHYMSPEAMRGWAYGTIADVWSFGIFTLKVAENRLPWNRCESDEEVMVNVIKTRAPELNPELNWSPEFRSMHVSAMQHNINERSTSAKLLKMKCWQKAATKEQFAELVKSYV